MKQILSEEERAARRRAQVRESTRAYRLRHPERVKAQAKQNNNGAKAKERRRRFYKRHAERLREARKTYYCENRDREAAYNRAWGARNTDKKRANNLRWKALHPERPAELNREWVRKNRRRYNALKAQRLKRVRLATPPWIDRKALARIYETCPSGYHVDHIMPITGKNFRGLHVPWNLQHLPAIENIRKGNRLCQTL